MNILNPLDALNLPEEEKKEKILISTPQMQIKGNVISFEDSFIQISNITRVTTYSITGKELKISTKFIVIWAIIFFIIFNYIPFKIAGFIAVCLLLYNLWNIHQCAKEVKEFNRENEGEYLSIYLTSGERLNFKSKDKEFLHNVTKVLEYCANNSNQDMVINFNNSKITNNEFDKSPITIGANNEIVIK